MEADDFRSNMSKTPKSETPYRSRKGCRVDGLGFQVSGLRFEVYDEVLTMTCLGFRNRAVETRAEDIGSEVPGHASDLEGFRVYGLGFVETRAWDIGSEVPGHASDLAETPSHPSLSSPSRLRLA
eukprot:2265606-Rhodomonas_salina.1